MYIENATITTNRKEMLPKLRKKLKKVLLKNRKIENFTKRHRKKNIICAI
jgi:hypothetical protein